MMRRREFFGIVAAMPAAAALPLNLSSVKSRTIKSWELGYKTPHPKPNALDITKEGMWIVDQGPETWVSLVNIPDGKVIREFKVPDAVGSTGVHVDADNVMWITGTHNSMIVSCSPVDGKVIAKYWTPGAGRIFQMKGDPPGRVSTLKPAYPDEGGQGRGPQGAGGRQGGRGGRGGGLGPGQLPMDATTGMGGTGAHAIVSKGNLLYYVCPPARQIFTIDKKTWEVQAAWFVPGNRPHGMTWDENHESLWNADSNLNAFYGFNIKTGDIFEKVQLPDDSPVVHGAKLHDGYMLMCDDVGWMWRVKWA